MTADGQAHLTEIKDSWGAFRGAVDSLLEEQ